MNIKDSLNQGDSTCLTKTPSSLCASYGSHPPESNAERREKFNNRKGGLGNMVKSTVQLNTLFEFRQALTKEIKDMHVLNIIGDCYFELVEKIMAEEKKEKEAA